MPFFLYVIIYGGATSILTAACVITIPTSVQQVFCTCGKEPGRPCQLVLVSPLHLLLVNKCPTSVQQVFCTCGREPGRPCQLVLVSSLHLLQPTSVQQARFRRAQRAWRALFLSPSTPYYLQFGTRKILSCNNLYTLLLAKNLRSQRARRASSLIWRVTRQSSTTWPHFSNPMDPHATHWKLEVRINEM